MIIGREWQTISGRVILRRGLALLMPALTVPILHGGLIGCVPLIDTIRPDSDPFGLGGWVFGAGSGGSAHSRLSVETETDTMFSDLTAAECGDSTEVFTLEVGLDNPSGAPGPFLCQAMDYTYRIRKTGSDPGTVDTRISLIQGTTVIDGPRLEADLDGTFFNENDLPTEAQYNNISDFDDLRLRIAATVCIDSIPDTDVKCEMAWNRIVFSAK